MNLLADTHAAIWFLWAPERLSQQASEAFDHAAERGDRIGLSTITLCETVYLGERGRIRADALPLLVDALQAQDGPFQEVVVDTAVAAAMQGDPCKRIPEMPDRIIAASAIAHNLRLVTKDRVIRAAGIPVVW